MGLRFSSVVQRYDALLAFRSDPTLVSAESAGRKADRHDWAKQQEEMVNRRIADFKQKMERERLRREDLRQQVKRAAEAQNAKHEANAVPVTRTNPVYLAAQQQIPPRKVEIIPRAQQQHTSPAPPVKKVEYTYPEVRDVDVLPDIAARKAALLQVCYITPRLGLILTDSW